MALLIALGSMVAGVSCGLLDLTGDAVVLTGKVASTAVKTTAVVVTTSAKVAATTVSSTARIGSATIARFKGKRFVDLEREGNSFYVHARINGRHKARLLLDTGASSVQITPSLARRAGVNVAKGDPVKCTLADGSTVAARAVTLKEVRLGTVRAKDVRALVLQNDASSDGDGLLGMSFLDNFIFQIDPQSNQLILGYKAK